MPHTRAYLGHRAAVGFLRCQRTSQKISQAHCVGKQFSKAEKLALTESGRSTNSCVVTAVVKQEELPETESWFHLGKGDLTSDRHCGQTSSGKRRYEDEHVQIGCDWSEAPWDAPWDVHPGKIPHTSNAEDEDTDGWSAKIRETLRKENRLPPCDNPLDVDSGAQFSFLEYFRRHVCQGQMNSAPKSEIFHGDPEGKSVALADTETLPALKPSLASHLSSVQGNQIGVCVQPAASRYLAFTDLPNPRQYFTIDPYKSGQACPPVVDPRLFQSSKMLPATCSTPHEDEERRRGQMPELVQDAYSLLSAPDHSVVTCPDCPPCPFAQKFDTVLRFPSVASMGEVTEASKEVSGVKVGTGEREGHGWPKTSFHWSPSGCSHRKRRLHAARLRAKAKAKAHRVKLRDGEFDRKLAVLVKEGSTGRSSMEAPGTNLFSTYRWRGSLEAVEEGKGGHKGDEGRRVEPRVKLEEVKEKLLFDKVLTKTDTSGLGRIILPKRPAEQYLPHVPCKEGIELDFEDCNNTVWKGRLRYWVNKSKMYVIEGAGGFLREHKLLLGDKILLFSSGPEKKLVIRYDRGPFLPQPPCNVATPLPAASQREPPAAQPPAPSFHPLPSPPNPLSGLSFSETFYSRSNLGPTPVAPTVDNTHLPTPTPTPTPNLPPPPPFSHPLCPPKPFFEQTLNPAGELQPPEPLLPENLQPPVPLPGSCTLPGSGSGSSSERHGSSALISPFSASLALQFSSQGPLSEDRAGDRGRRNVSESPKLFPTATSSALNNGLPRGIPPASASLSTATAAQLQKLPRVRMKSGRLLPPLVVAALLQSAMQLQRRRVRAMPSVEREREKESPPLTNVKVEDVKTETRVGGRGEALAGHVAPPYGGMEKSDTTMIGDSFLNTCEGDDFMRLKGGDGGGGKEGVRTFPPAPYAYPSGKNWCGPSQPFVPMMDEAANASILQGWGEVGGEMGGALFSNGDDVDDGNGDVKGHGDTCTIGRASGGGAEMSMDTQGMVECGGLGLGKVGDGEDDLSVFGDLEGFGASPSQIGLVGTPNRGSLDGAFEILPVNQLKGGLCSPMDPVRSVDLATTESCLGLFDIDLPSVPGIY